MVRGKKTLRNTIDTSMLQKAREGLNTRTMPDELPGRSDEYLSIYAHVDGALEYAKGCCIYISGVPGTGKTATVTKAIKDLQVKCEFTYIYVNGMKLTDPSYAYVQLWQVIMGDQSKKKTKVSPAYAEEQLEKYFKAPKRSASSIVIVLDELDLMFNSKQSVLYNFFNWPSLRGSNLIVVAIANTMDLPERALSNKITSRLGLTRINFLPYTHEQLKEIVSTRLKDAPIFEHNAIVLCSRKVAAVSGDARRALDICNRAMELYDNAQTQEKLIPIKFITEAIDEMFKSRNVSFIFNSSYHQKIFLIALLSVFKQTGIAEATFKLVADRHVQFCKSHNLSHPSITVLLTICKELAESSVLIAQEGARNDINMKIKLKIAENDIFLALKNDKDVKELFDKLFK